MIIDTFFEIMNTYPAGYFILGIIVGYFLHGLVASGFSSKTRGKRPSRYDSKKTDTTIKRPSVVAESSEPFFWAVIFSPPQYYLAVFPVLVTGNSLFCASNFNENT